LTRDAAELARTGAERACLDALRDAAGGRGGAVELHSARVFEIATRLARSPPDRELLLCASLLHDVGLYPGVDGGGPYVTEGRHHAARVLAAFDWPPDRLKRCLDAIELHHHWRPVWRAGAEAELIRRADLVELSAGTIRFGLPRSWLRELAGDWPRRGFYAGLARLLAPIAAHRPLALARIFTVRR
jgi:hypothetical protein